MRECWFLKMLIGFSKHFNVPVFITDNLSDLFQKWHLAHHTAHQMVYCLVWKVPVKQRNLFFQHDKPLLRIHPSQVSISKPSGCAPALFCVISYPKSPDKTTKTVIQSESRQLCYHIEENLLFDYLMSGCFHLSGLLHWFVSKGNSSCGPVAIKVKSTGQNC